MEDIIADHGSGYEACESQDVGDGIDILVSWEGDLGEDLFRCRGAEWTDGES